MFSFRGGIKNNQYNNNEENGDESPCQLALLHEIIDF